MSNLELFVKVAVAMLIILVVAQVIGRLIMRVGQPAVVGEMIAGVLLGPTCFGYFFPKSSVAVFPKDIMPVLFVVSNIGLSIYMFLVGAEIDLNMFNRKAAKDATALSLAAVIVPFLMGGLAAWMFNDQLNVKHIDNLSMIIFLGTAFAITAFPMLARLLQERQIVNTRIGVLSLLSASIQDVVSWILLGLVTAMASTHDYFSVLIMVLGAALLVTILFFVVKPLLRKMAVKVTDPIRLPPVYFATVMVLLLSCALITDFLGLYSVFGGFILGLSLPRDGALIKAITLRLKDITVVFLLPIFFTFSGLNTDLTVLSEFNLLVPALVLILFAFVSKYFSSMFTMRWVSGFSWREASAIGGLINARGLMELIIANIGLFYGFIDVSFYSILVLIAIISTLCGLPIYNISMRQKQKVERSMPVEA